MSESKTKAYRKMIEKTFKENRREFTAKVLLSMQACSFKQRLHLAWKILKGEKK